jgi:hypothetical protein
MGAEEPDREAEEAEENKPAAYDQRAWEMLNPVERDPLGKFLCSRVLWLNVFVSALIASPWYIRNIIVTGNPVYAFFYNIFPSRNVNPEVMRSAQVEWLMNGDGLGRVGATLWEKLANSWLYFVTGPHHWKLGPVFMALAVPGFVVFLCRIWSRLVVGQRLVNLGELPGSPPRTRVFDDSLKFGTVCGALFVLLWFYAYVIADMYLYQIIIVLPLFGIFVCGVFEVCNTRFSRVLLYVLCIVVGIGPGIMMGLMGFKLKRSGHIGATPYSQVTLTALRYLFIAPEEFYRMEFGGDMEMLGRVNSLPAGTRVLTHENRHLLLNEDIRIIHLDDWEVQKAYHKPASERLAVLDALGVEYYLYVPNEDKHFANSWLGMDELIRLGHFREVARTEAAGSSWRERVKYLAIPPDRNVLYRRAKTFSDQALSFLGVPTDDYQPKTLAALSVVDRATSLGLTSFSSATRSATRGR